MPIMTWDDSLDIGVEAMNREHREILDAMNAIFDAHAAAQHGPGINRLIEKLGEITKRHFADEERYMASINFPELGVHRRIHATLLQDFARHAEGIKSVGGIANPAFFGFLKRWLAAHIKGIDAKYAAHSRNAA